MGVAFTIFPADTSMIGFPLVKWEIRLVDYLYFFMEHVITIIFAFIIYSESTEYKKPLLIFTWLMVADLFDFVLTFNNPWFSIAGMPVSMNSVSLLVFG
jgi:hypothetical protein